VSYRIIGSDLINCSQIFRFVYCCFQTANLWPCSTFVSVLIALTALVVAVWKSISDQENRARVWQCRSVPKTKSVSIITRKWELTSLVGRRRRECGAWRWSVNCRMRRLRRRKRRTRTERRTECRPDIDTTSPCNRRILDHTPAPCTRHFPSHSHTICRRKQVKNVRAKQTTQ